MALPGAVDRRFEAMIFDWDGTAVPNRRSGAAHLRRLVEELSRTGMDLAVVSGTHVENVDRQLYARPRGPGQLHLLVNRGSEVYRVGPAGPELVHRREATRSENAALSRAAEGTVRRLHARGVSARVVSERLNRKKIDLLPDPAWEDPPKARIAELVSAVEERLRASGIEGLREAVDIATGAAIDAGLPGARVTTDAKHVEIGLTDKSDSARWMVADLWERGIGPGLVLIVGDEWGPLGGLPGSDALMLVPEAARATVASVGAEPFGVPPGIHALGGGPESFLALLEDQLDRRLAGEVPWLDDDPTWLLQIDGFDPEMERAHEALLTVADGRIGTRGAPLRSHRAAVPMVLAAGVYEGRGADSELLKGPAWNVLPGRLDPQTDIRRALDLHTGLLRQDLEANGSRVQALSFSSAARPGTVALRAGGNARLLRNGGHAGPRGSEEGVADGVRWARVRTSPGGIAVAWSEERHAQNGAATLERLGAYESGTRRIPRVERALHSLKAARRDGFDRLLYDHRSAWARRWAAADVAIVGDPDLQRAVRLALFHLMGSAANPGEAAVGARGLTGTAYRGHVFWDADVFVLPFLAATDPLAARAMLEYRLRRLDEALRAAKLEGRVGARFPWESAATGKDVTPSLATELSGSTVTVLTGRLEEHIVADVAWAAACYEDWTGDGAFRSGPGRTLLVQTARYWASRVEIDADGSGHIRGVMGPDEYHGPVDDNAFTNVMARWNLRRAATATRSNRGVSQKERDTWLRLAAAVVDGYDPATGLYEQFLGFFDLEPLVISEVVPHRPVAADVLLGEERVAAAQVVKQADVLMLHHLVPDQMAPGSLQPNLDFYEPRTSHGSTLSPGVHASLFARAGRIAQAMDALRLTARIDLDDLTGTTAGGVHLAAMGSVWQALAFGFAGLRPAGPALHLDPHMPDDWEALEISVRFRGRRVRVRLRSDLLEVDAAAPVPIDVPGVEDRLTVGPEGLRLEPADVGWKVVKP